MMESWRKKQFVGNGARHGRRLCERRENIVGGSDVSARGFSLIEVLVAMTVFSVGVLGVMGTLSLSARTAGESTRLWQAVELAENQMEMAVSGILSSRETMQSGTSDAYQWVLRFDEKPNDLLLASVQIRWMERGERREFQMSRLFRPRER
jgi:prepilin-type N-terminal cleavage/methylation domain-containing protein